MAGALALHGLLPRAANARLKQTRADQQLSHTVTLDGCGSLAREQRAALELQRPRAVTLQSLEAGAVWSRCGSRAPLSQVSGPPAAARELGPARLMARALAFDPATSRRLPACAAVLVPVSLPDCQSDGSQAPSHCARASPPALEPLSLSSQWSSPYALSLIHI